MMIGNDRVKERWPVSIKAQITRLSDLDIMPEDLSHQLYKLYSAKGWSKGEPLDQHWSIQQPRALRDSLNLIVDNGVRSKADLFATELTISATDVELLCGLPSGWFDRDPAEVVTLKRGKLDGEILSQGEAQIIAFPDRNRR
jgi:hypothetical protein